MKVGTDGVLLGAWADLEQAHQILDIGTGTGLLALMAAQRNSSAHIDAIEIEEHAVQQAQENIQASPWRERIFIFPQALQQYTPNKKYDCILCNPPFFKHSTKALDKGRRLARHNDTLPLSDLVTHAVRLLQPTGILCVILPVLEAEDFMTYSQQQQLYVHHLTRVAPTPTKPPKRYLIQVGFQEKKRQEDNLILEFSRHQYSPEYALMTAPFYLK